MKAPKKPVAISKVMKMDSKADKAMSPAMMKKDIAADRKLLASKVAAPKGKNK